MHYIKQAWSLLRWAWFLVLLLWPLALAAWVFHLALGLHTGPMDYWMGFLGFMAILLLFRGFWKPWIVFFRRAAPAVWRFAINLSADLRRLARHKLKAASYRIRTDWTDLRRVFK
ncbi:MAG: hypothetical protein KGL42_00275 [Betaproteobacteria bacterium]|jgi:hypothetical protein|nr:hypothetical protein [Betaproteobacteria bacterium]